MPTRKRWIALGLVVAGLAWIGAEGYRVYRIVRAPEAPVEPAPVADAGTRRELAQGAIVGFVGTGGAHVWRGIPFAEPPVGALRWKAPRPAPSWEGERAAIAPSPSCPQPRQEDGTSTVVGDEDCLYLDVYAPPDAAGKQLPTLLWIHGGANIQGSASQTDAGRLAAKHRLVIVATNYRLGPLGWFAHPALHAADAPAVQDAGVDASSAADGDAGADVASDDAFARADRSGNFGTLDTIAALTWIRDNIARFGGDPGNVTIFGVSAGGANVLSLLLSPAASGLFHRAISQSGVLYSYSMQEASAFANEGGHSSSSAEILVRLLVAAGRAADAQQARALAARLSAAEIASFLREQPPAALFKTALQPRPEGDDRPPALPTVFRDGDVIGEADATERFARGDYNQVPVILGTNRDELKSFMVRNPELTRQPRPPLVRIRDRELYAVLSEYRSEAWRAGTVNLFAPRMRAAQQHGVFAYRFDWDEEPDLVLVDLSELLGAAHGLDVPFVFGHFDRGGMTRLLFTEDNAGPRNALSDAMMSYWAQLAYTGAPERGRSGSLPEWKPWSDQGENLLALDTDSGGGIRMLRDAPTIDDLLERLAGDERLPEPIDKCRVLYWLSYRGRHVPEQAYTTTPGIDCSAFPPERYPWRANAE